MFSDSVGLDSTSLVYFNIEDRNGDSVYLSPISITDIHFDTTMFNLPGINAAVIPITWNGRYNVGEHNGHFADPENDPYLAYISVNPRSGNPMYSNADTAYVVPKLDSILITHTKHNYGNPYPPPDYGDSVYIYTIIRGKIDDSGDSINDRRYYYGYGTNPSQLLLWDKITYKYWDLDSVNYYCKYYEDTHRIPLNLTLCRPWKELWGNLSFTWGVYRDYAVRPDTSSPQHIYYYLDTTYVWGNAWNRKFVNDIQWWKDTLFFTDICDC
jgi:hypothetical protein